MLQDKTEWIRNGCFACQPASLPLASLYSPASLLACRLYSLAEQASGLIDELSEALEQLQAEPLAFFGMELRSKDVVFPYH